MNLSNNVIKLGHSTLNSKNFGGNIDIERFFLYAYDTRKKKWYRIIDHERDKKKIF